MRCQPRPSTPPPSRRPGKAPPLRPSRVLLQLHFSHGFIKPKLRGMYSGGEFQFEAQPADPRSPRKFPQDPMFAAARCRGSCSSQVHRFIGEMQKSFFRPRIDRYEPTPMLAGPSVDSSPSAPSHSFHESARATSAPHAVHFLSTSAAAQHKFVSAERNANQSAGTCLVFQCQFRCPRAAATPPNAPASFTACMVSRQKSARIRMYRLRR